MIHIKMLENSDLVKSDDWCRPLTLLSMSGGHSDSYSFRSQYSNTPENNVRWAQVNSVFGKCWFGQSVQKINKAMAMAEIKYEFIRGDIPESHKLSMAGYGKI